MKIASKLNIPIIGGLAGLVAFGLFIMNGVISRQGVQLTQDTLRSVLEGAEQTREATARLHEEKAFDLEALVGELDRVGKDRFRETALYRTVPIVAAWKNASFAAEQRGFKFRVVRDNPRFSDNAPVGDEVRILRALEKPGVKELFEEDKERGLLIAAKPIVLTRDCLMCHGDPKNSPTKDGKDILGFPMENWNVGEVRGAFILTSEIAPIRATSWRATATTATWVMPFVLLVCGCTLVYVRRFIVRPLNGASELALSISRGDLTRKIETKSDDEIGTLSDALNTTTTKLRTMIADIATQSGSLASAAASLNQVARTQSAGTEAVNVRANSVASAGEDLSSSVQTMAADSGRITEAVGGVASSMEEMSASIQEVAGNCAKGAEISHQADQQARATKEMMSKLDESARQISKIIGVIHQIAEQTNLLALNASIEAASAGEAGRGFAVVANEVKELARQSDTASAEIRKQIELIQAHTGSAVVSIEEVTRVIQQVSQMTSSIAAAVEEQSATTSEVTRSLQSVSASTASLSGSISRTAAGTEEVSRNIRGVSEASAENAQSAASVTDSASQLSTLAGDLRRIVSQFRLEEGTSNLPDAKSPTTPTGDKTAMRQQLSEALAAHSLWKERLRKAVATGKSDYSPQVVCEDNRCDFGRWLYALPESTRNADRWKCVRSLHADFHRCAGHTLASALKGEKAAAERALASGGEFHKATLRLSAEVLDWQKELS